MKKFLNKITKKILGRTNFGTKFVRFTIISPKSKCSKFRKINLGRKNFDTKFFRFTGKISTLIGTWFNKCQFFNRILNCFNWDKVNLGRSNFCTKFECFTIISPITNCFNLAYSKKTYKVAFTLAEVLVTITVIGAIAAMTLPNLNSHFKKIEYSTKLKNFVSNMDRAIELMELEKGSFKNMKKPADVNKMFDWYMENIDPYLGHQYIDRTKRTIYFKDGSTLYIRLVGWAGDVDFDINGNKKPNTYGIDQFCFLMAFNDYNTYYFTNQNTFWGPYYELSIRGKARATAKNLCKQSPKYCTRLLELDGWEFKSDYPYKIK